MFPLFPPTEPIPIVRFTVVMGGIAATLIAMLALFRRARRVTCRWPRAWRIAAQVPGWCLVPLGAFGIVALAITEIREKRGGLGLGTLMAVIGATVKALFRGSTSDQSA